MLPHMLFITCHDLGQHLGCYGQATVQSPRLDALAAEGALMRRSFCPAPQCSPSRAGLHTGCYPHRVGVMGLAHDPFNWALTPPTAHLAHTLRTAGYQTALFGVQHVVRRPVAPALGYDHIAPGGPAAEMAQAAVEYLRAQPLDQPQYLEVGFFEPHREYDFGGVQPDDSLGVNLPGYVPDVPAAREEFAALQGAIHALDGGVGLLLDALDELGIRENTWVVFVADHGLAMPRAKCTLYDPGLETSLMMRWPQGGITPGGAHEAMISHVDIVPTVLQGLGLPVPQHLDGRSFWPMLTGGDYAPREAIFAEQTYHTVYNPIRAIRTETHKLIVNFEMGTRVDVPDDVRQGPLYVAMREQVTGHREHIELYDLIVDPLEQQNLAGQPQVAALEAALKTQLFEWMHATRDPLLAGPVASPFRAEALRQFLDQSGD